MTLQRLDPMLATDDMDRTIRFYTEVLGFNCEGQSPVFSTVSRDGVRIMFGGAPGPDSCSGQTWTGAKFTGQLYIAMDTPEAVDALWERVKDRVTALYAPDDFDYGMHEFGIHDDNGYQLSFGARSAKTG